MPYFLADGNLNLGQTSSITGQEADHILLARRAKKGEEIKLQGSDGKRFLATISEIKKHEVVVNPFEEIKVPEEPRLKITLFQSVVASGTLDMILQKATELGAAEVVLYNSEFTATKLSADKYQSKQERWQKIMWEAAKQSERAHPPRLSFAEDLDGVVKLAEDLDELVIFDISGKPSNVKGHMSNVGVVIGPEGGLSQSEIQSLSALKNSHLVTLGPRLLKAETAAIASLAILQN